MYIQDKSLLLLYYQSLVARAVYDCTPQCYCREDVRRYFMLYFYCVHAGLKD